MLIVRGLIAVIRLHTIMDEETTHDRTTVLISFGSTVRNLRTELGFSQEEFADHCGLDRTYIGGVERGERNIGLVNVYRIASALELDVSVLFQNIEAGGT